MHIYCNCFLVGMGYTVNTVLHLITESWSLRLVLRGDEFGEQLYLLRFFSVTLLVAVRPIQLRACTGVLQTLSIDPSSSAVLQTHIPSGRSNSPGHNELSPHSIFSHCGLSYR